VVILAVSLATLLGAVIMRRLLTRPGGIASSALLATPLILPLVAALIYQRGLLPEISVMKPFGTAIMEHSQQLFHLLMVNDGNTVIPYAISGQAGPYILLIGLSVVSFMLIRRAVGMALVSRWVRRCRPVGDPQIERIVGRLARRCDLGYEPQVLMLPDGISGAFAAGLGRGKILISRDLIDALDPEELKGILAHEIAHLRSRDVPVVFVAGLLRDLVVWNPFAHVALRKLISDREYEADRRAAALTGDPLSVASGLLRIVEVARDRKGLSQRAVLAFWRPGHSISRRVTQLIAVADGKSSSATPTQLPFLMATLLVAVLGFQVAERVVSERSGGLAIVWGDPATAGGEIWEAPKRIGRVARPAWGTSVSAKHKKKVDLALPVRQLFSPEIRVMASDIENWVLAVSSQLATSQIVGVRGATFRWEARRNWTAEPIFSSPVVAPIGIYRINQQI
jgi:Zn-dependent protease with chaperone function